MILTPARHLHDRVDGIGGGHGAALPEAEDLGPEPADPAEHGRAAVRELAGAHLAGVAPLRELERVPDLVAALDRRADHAVELRVGRLHRRPPRARRDGRDERRGADGEERQSAHHGTCADSVS